MTVSPLAEYDAQMEALHAQMQPLLDRLRSVGADRRAYADSLARETDDIATLMALRDASQVAYQKLAEDVRATSHDAIWTFIDYLPIEDDYATGYALGPHLTAERMPTDVDGLTALAASMSEFATRYSSPAPELSESTMSREAGVDVCGMVLADVLGSDCEARHSYYVYYIPDGSQAYLFDQYALGETIAQGSLVEVLAEVVRLDREALRWAETCRDEWN